MVRHVVMKTSLNHTCDIETVKTVDNNEYISFYSKRQPRSRDHSPSCCKEYDCLVHMGSDAAVEV